jgi:3-hydroxyacyl-CoA dehydrogenase
VSRLKTVEWRIVENVQIVMASCPPPHTLDDDLHRALIAAIDFAEKNGDVRAVLLVGTGDHFIPGSNMLESGATPVTPSLWEVCGRIEACNKPVIAGIDGAALGTGLEIVLSTHYRLALTGAKLGFPEVKFGLIPSGGATQRAPRLIGVAASLDLMLTGRHASAKEACRLGLIDRLVEGPEATSPGLAYAQELIAAKAPVRPTRAARTAPIDDESGRVAIIAARRDTATNAHGLFSPTKIIDAVEAAATQPFETGVAIERGLFLECLASPQRAALLHAHFAEREVFTAPETNTATSRPIDIAAVIGGGTMGAGIAIAMLDAGLAVQMIERDEPGLARGRMRVEKVYDGLILKGRMTLAGKQALMARLCGSISYQAVAEADIVVEAAFEDMEVKKKVFAELDRFCKTGAVLASNTSYLDIDEIASGISRPADVLGLHFFSPANVMKLLEIVVPTRVDGETVATAFELAKRLGKIPVRAGVCDGFIGNRIFAKYWQAAEYLLEDGASPYQIDQAIREFGYPMGPFQVADLAGGDIGWATRKRKSATRDPRERYVHIADRLCERGWFGQKTGRGYYLYSQGARTGVPDPEVTALIEEERVRAGVKPRSFTNAEIIRRYMAAIINEGANVVRERVALRPLDVDITFLHGYGFPRYRGGPMYYADNTGLANVLADIQELGNEDPSFWNPSPLLAELVDRRADFASLNHIE